MPEFTQLDRVKSIIRYFPAKATAGFVLFAVKTPNLDPSPPASIIALTFIAPPEKTKMYYSTRYWYSSIYFCADISQEKSIFIALSIIDVQSELFW
jgi:hypothetical protein